MISTALCPSSWKARMRCSGMPRPMWMSGDVTSIPSFTRSCRPVASFFSSSPAGKTSTALRVSSWIATPASVEPVSGAGRMLPMTPELAHLSDEALVALAARSEQTALAELYDRYGRPAYGLALRILRDEALAEDAVQDAFLALWRTAPRFVPEKGKASTWILTLVHRRAVDVVRREQRRRTDSLEGTPEPSSATEVDEEAWLRLQRERVQEALRQLPDQQREALELAYYGGFTQSELAERLGQPLGTIKSRMFMGLTRLRELLGETMMETEWTSTS